jgi:hypothetical protein
VTEYYAIVTEHLAIVIIEGLKANLILIRPLHTTLSCSSYHTSWTTILKTNAATISGEKGFPQHGYLCLHRLVKRAAFTCNHCSLGKISKLVAFRQGQMGRTYVQWLLWLSTFCFGETRRSTMIYDMWWRRMGEGRGGWRVGRHGRGIARGGGN